MDWLYYAFIGFMTCAALVCAVIVLCCCVANADFDAMIEREKEFEEWKMQHKD